MSKRPVIACVFVYLVVQVAIIALLAYHQRLDTLTAASAVRPVAIIIIGGLFYREGGRWSLWLAVAAGSGLLRYLRDPPGGPAAMLEAGSQLLLTIGAVWYWSKDPKYFALPVLARIKARFLREPDLITIPLGSSLDDVQKSHASVHAREAGSWLVGCDHHELCLPDQKITIASDAGVVRGVIYNTDVYRDSEAERIRKLRFFLKAHGDETPLRFVVNNGFGFLYRDTSNRIRASYSYMADIFAVSYFDYEMKSARGRSDSVDTTANVRG